MKKLKRIVSIVAALAIFAANCVSYEFFADNTTTQSSQQIELPTGGLIPVHGEEMSDELVAHFKSKMSVSSGLITFSLSTSLNFSSFARITRVITSYSIHYTKLYEATIATTVMI